MEINQGYFDRLGQRAKEAVPLLACAGTDARNDALEQMMVQLEAHTEEIIAANEADLANPELPAKMRDRLKLDEKRIGNMADGIAELIRMPDPLGRGEQWIRPNGLTIRRIRVPLGVMAVVYEARPNVTSDISALGIKTGNAILLRGGKEAIRTNRILVDCMRAALRGAGLPEDGVQLVDDVTREGTQYLMSMRSYVDVLVPRGSAGLIRSVTENARVPVIETGAGNCHIYVDEAADPDKAVRITVNAKVSRPSVCNAAESLVVHRSVAPVFLPKVYSALTQKGVELRGDEETRKLLPQISPATEEDFYTEYNDLILSVKMVGDLEEAITHINRHSTHHSEAIVTERLAAARRFQEAVDSAVVYVNASTRFTDGGEFGFGAELGISTQKLHARGPMGMDALTTVKYLVDGGAYSETRP